MADSNTRGTPLPEQVADTVQDELGDDELETVAGGAGGISDGTSNTIMVTETRAKHSTKYGDITLKRG